jgi:CRAL/TRIO domain
MKFTQEAFPVKLKKIHLINVSPVLNKVLLVLRPFMNSRVRNSMNFHLPNTTTMFDDVPQELLPNEYGGKAGAMSEIKKNFIKQIEANR